jgi:hypothetical protein
MTALRGYIPAGGAVGAHSLDLISRLRRLVRVLSFIGLWFQLVAIMQHTTFVCRVFA